MCLPTCPTYISTSRERNSPRGRIAWMRAIADQEVELDSEFAAEMYYCLGCLACQSACPAGVNYASLFEAARADIEDAGAAGGGQRIFWRWLAVKTIFMHPRLLRLIGRGLHFYQCTGLQDFIRRSGLLRLLPARLRELEPQTPEISKHFSNELIAPVECPDGEVRYRVGLLTGCVQDIAFSDINRDTVDVLLAAGCEVQTPPVQHCCGSLHAHNGEVELARRLARHQLDLFDLNQLDAIITNAGGCGSHLKSYGHLLEDDPEYTDRAKLWDSKCKDVHEWLVQIGFSMNAQDAVTCDKTAITYHESCHLCHGQGIRRQPRQLLDTLSGTKRVELPESDWCCGSAGIYNITQPEESARLLNRKLDHIERSGASIITTANPGCHLQLLNGLKNRGKTATVSHPISLIAQALRNNPPKPDSMNKRHRI